MIKHMYLLFFICGSMSAVKDVPTRDSMTIIFEEHPPAKVMNSCMNKNIFKENDNSILCLDDKLESEECTPILCAASICIADGAVKVCSASKALLVCLGIL